MRKIDVHAHVTKRPLEGLAEYSATPENLAKRMSEYGIEKSVVLATYFPNKGSGVSNFRLYDWIKDRNDMVMFGSLDFEHYFFQGYNELEELASRSVLYGLKVYSSYQKIDFGSWQFNKFMELAKKYDFPVMFHTGHAHGSGWDTKFHDLEVSAFRLDESGVFRKYPETRFILSHLSNPHFDEATLVACTYENVWCDMSGLINSSHERHEIVHMAKQVKAFVQEAGPKKLLFGTDYPVQTHADSLDIAKLAFGDLSFDEQQKIFYDNAKEVLRI